MGRVCYLPFVSGLLHAYADTYDEIRDGYEFMPYLYRVDNVQSIVQQYTDAPDVAAFSVAMWNEQLNLRVAYEVKRRWPECLVIFGGAQVPHYADGYLERYPWVDVTVRGEGEEPFVDVLRRFLESRDFSGIPQVSFRLKDQVKVERADRQFSHDLDAHPSPYVEGYFDHLLARQDESLEFQAIIETNRGCPFLCSFCYWGRGGMNRKHKFYDVDRVLKEVEWCGQNKMRYVLNADSNFGMHRRDREIAEFIVETKKRYGYPEKFRTNYGKNSDEKIFEIGLLFHEHGLEKGITLARQSNDAETLKNIKRGNIKMSTYRNLQTKFNDKNVMVYSEFICGLPGETVETWKRGIDEIVGAGMRNQVFIYPCLVLPNTELSDPAYMAKHGIKTRRIKLAEFHGSVRDDSWATEYEDIAVETGTMTPEDWKAMMTFSYVFLVLHSMKVGQYLIMYMLDRHGVKPSEVIDFIIQHSDGLWRDEINEYNRILDGVLNQTGSLGVVMPGWGDLYWEVEEASFMRISERVGYFHHEIHRLLWFLLRFMGKPFDAAELLDAVVYQSLRIPTAGRPWLDESVLGFNFHDYFESVFGSAPAPLVQRRQHLLAEHGDYDGDRERFAREVILMGRKSGAVSVPVREVSW